MQIAWALLLGALLASPAAADMYQDASNAKLPDSLNHLGLGAADTPNFAGLKLNGGEPFSQLGIKYNGTSPLLMSILDPTANHYLFRLYAGSYMSLNTNAADGYTQGPPIVVGFDTAAPVNGTSPGHYAYQMPSSDHQIQTVAFMDAMVTDVGAASIKSQWRVGIMNNVVSVPGTVSQPNAFMTFDGVTGLQLPGAVKATASIYAGGIFVSNNKNVIGNAGGLTQIFDDAGTLGIALAGSYSFYAGGSHIFASAASGGTTYASIDSHGIVVPVMPASCTGAASKTLWNNAGVVNICP